MKVYDNTVKVGEIPPPVLKERIAKLIKKLMLDNSQAVMGEEFGYMVASVCNEMSKHSKMMWGELLYIFDVGPSGKYGPVYKINTNAVKHWLLKYKEEKAMKVARNNDAKHEKITKNPMAPFMGAAVRLRMDSMELSKYPLRKVAETIKDTGCRDRQKLLNILKNGRP